MDKKVSDFIEQENIVSAHNYHPLPVVIKKAQGVYVWDINDKKYLDMLSAYSALNQGHCHPKIIDAAIRQMKNLTLTSRAFHNDQMTPFLNKLTRLTGFDKALLMNSGAEAVETAIKAVRSWGYLKKGVESNKANIIVCSNNFHGRTTTIVGFSNDKGSRKEYGPYGNGFKLIPYGDILSLKGAIDENTVGFLVEPIQGEAGVKVPPANYLKEAKAVCEENEVLLIADEIQTGLGRTGKMFCYEYDQIKPDILIVGKALGGGVYPVSGILSDSCIMDIAFQPGSHGSTFGGNPLACAIASAALDVITEEGLVENSFKLGRYFKEELVKLNSPFIKEVRGKGLMIGIELNNKATKAREITEALSEKGVLAKETHGTIIRFAPPLIIQKPDLAYALKVIEEVLCKKLE